VQGVQTLASAAAALQSHLAAAAAALVRATPQPRFTRLIAIYTTY